MGLSRTVNPASAQRLVGLQANKAIAWKIPDNLTTALTPYRLGLDPTATLWESDEATGGRWRAYDSLNGKIAHNEVQG